MGKGADGLDAVLPGHLQGLLGDADLARLIDGRAQLRAMLRVEAALAAAQARHGAIPKETAAPIDAAARGLARTLAPADLAEATARDGVAVPELVTRLRAAVAETDAAAASFVHYGATSQDIVDSAWMLCLADALALFERRVAVLGERLADLAAAHRDTVMLARTRTQAATPTVFGLKAAQWLAALTTHRRDLVRLRRERLALSLGGAAGTQAALGPDARAVETALAEALGLSLPATPWHARREDLAAVGAAAAGLAGSLAKIAQDVLLLGQSEVGEVALAGAGGSSTMPNKRNPTAAEAVLALARHAGAQQTALTQTLPAAHERDGAGWMLEWLSLPPLLLAAGAALDRTGGLIDALQVAPDRMRANLDATGGLALAEAASFALSAHMPRADAQAMVKRACAEAVESGRPLMELLAEFAPDAPVDWAMLADPLAHVGQGPAMINRALADWRAGAAIEE